MLKNSAFSLVLCIAALAPAAARDDGRDIPNVLMSAIRPGATLLTFMRHADRTFSMADPDGDGQIGPADVDLLERILTAKLVAAGVQSILAHDLGGDGIVTEAELETVINLEGLSKAASFAPLRRFMAFDGDGDRRLSFSEILAAARDQASRRRPVEQTNNASSILAYFAAETLSRPQFVTAVGALFSSLDTDGDGVLSAQELSKGAFPLRDAGRERREVPAADTAPRADINTCVFPKPSNEAKVIGVSTYDTRALSSVTLGSQNNVIFTAMVTIEPGFEPLYLILSSYSPVIWRFTGATERVERVVLSSGTSDKMQSQGDKVRLAGATGVSPQTVSFLTRADCLPSQFKKEDGTASEALRVIKAATGREPVIGAEYSVEGFVLPSARPQRVNEDPKPWSETKNRVRSSMARFFPGGVIDIAPSDVVASAPADRYDVLPSQAGLVQLVEQGAIEMNGGEFIIKKKIRFPPGLYGAHSVRFVLKDGVPYPDGDLGHSCLVKEGMVAKPPSDRGQSRGPGCSE